MDNKCPFCNARLPSGANFCMHCCSLINEKAVPTQTNIKNKKLVLIVVSLIVLAALLVTALIYNKTASPDNKKNAAVSQAVSQTEVSKEATAVSVIKETKTTEVTSETTTKQTTVTQTSTLTQTTADTTLTEETTTTTETTKLKKTTASKTTNKKLKVKKFAVIENGVLKSYPRSSKATSYTIPYSVTSIDKNAFNNKYLKKLKFSKRENLSCDWNNLFSSLPNLETIYIYAGTSVDTEGMQYFSGEIVYYYD